MKPRPRPERTKQARAARPVRAAGTVPLRSSTGLAILVATVVGSSMAFIDATVVNLALPEIGKDLGGGVSGQTWVVNAYNLTLASLILIGGALGDRRGHLQVFLFGVAWFSVASVLCAAAPNMETLAIARAGQGVGAALLTPASLALIQAHIRPEDRGRAIGLWSGLTGVAAVLGPLVGGLALAAGSWRAVFLINVPLGAAVLIAASRAIPRTAGSRRPTDWAGSLLLVAALAEISYGLTRWAEHPFATPSVAGTLFLGVTTLVLFGMWQLQVAEPLLPPIVWASQAFVWVNAVTLLIYGALAGVFLWLVVELQAALGVSPIAAGFALLPVTVLMLVFSPWAGAWGDRVGPRWPMTLGALVAAVAVAWLSRVDTGSGYVLDVLVPVTVLGVGLTLTVTPLTSAALSALPDDLAGVASGTNNAVARTGGLLAVAALPLVSALGGGGFGDMKAVDDAFTSAMLCCSALLLLAAVASALFVPSRATTPAAGFPVGSGSVTRHCAVVVPPPSRH